MKAAEITDQLITDLRTGRHRHARINYANGDMVGHTGHRDAAVAAVESVDREIGRLLPVMGLLASLAIRPAPEQSVENSTRGLREVRWRLPVAFGTNLPALGDNALYIGERIEAVSGGRFRVEIFEPGKLVPALSIVDAVREKKVPAGYTWLG